MPTRKKNPLGVKPYDAVHYLKTPDDIRLFLHAVIADADGDLRYLVDAINAAVRAAGVAKIAKTAGITRDGLYKAFAKNANPGFATTVNVLKALGIDILEAAAKTYQRSQPKHSTSRRTH